VAMYRPGLLPGLEQEVARRRHCVHGSFPVDSVATWPACTAHQFVVVLGRQTLPVAPGAGCSAITGRRLSRARALRFVWQTDQWQPRLVASGRHLGAMLRLDVWLSARITREGAGMSEKPIYVPISLWEWNCQHDRCQCCGIKRIYAE